MANQEVVRAKRYSRCMSLMMIDVDYFKSVNDQFGHAAGDEVLGILSRLLVSLLRSADIIGRIGGEEFAILLPESNLDEAYELAERIRAMVSATPIQMAEGSIRVSVSIGVAEITHEDVSIGCALKRADIGLYKSKNAGRDRVS